MKKSLVIATISLLTMGSASVLASDLTIPNTFVSGTPAVAADVNANFDAIEDAVDDNDARITATEAAITTKAPIIHGHAGEDISSGTVAEARIDQAVARDSEIMPRVLSSDGTGSGLDADTLDGLNSSAFAQTSAVVGIVNAATNVDADTLNGQPSSAFATTTHSHSGADITSGTVAEPRIDAAITRDSEVVGIVNAAPNVDADTLDGFSATSFASTADTNDLDTRITAIENGISACPSDMVKVGPICVDKYEASVWNSPTTNVTQYGTGTDYPCLDNGSDCGLGAANPIYAKSIAGVLPSASITWFQALQACANVGKRLLTNAEWQTAASGTPNTKPNTACRVSGGSAANTDGNPSCISSWGVINMVGNVNEWTADWMQGTSNNSRTVVNSVDFTGSTYTTITIAEPRNGTGDLGVDYDSDAAFGVIQPSNGGNFPAAVYRGGGYGGGGVFSFNASYSPTASLPQVGFRCAL